jgi:hypothetical protein
VCSTTQCTIYCASRSVRFDATSGHVPQTVPSRGWFDGALLISSRCSMRPMLERFTPHADAGRRFEAWQPRTASLHMTHLKRDLAVKAWSNTTIGDEQKLHDWAIQAVFECEAKHSTFSAADGSLRCSMLVRERKTGLVTPSHLEKTRVRM